MVVVTVEVGISGTVLGSHSHTHNDQLQTIIFYQLINENNNRTKRKNKLCPLFT